MVRGNWERRAEIAATRRADSKQRKEERKTRVKTVNGESVYQKLITYLDFKDVKIDAWLRHDPIIKCCSLHMRTEECNNRRCPFSHSCTTLALYPNIQRLSPPPLEVSSSFSSSSPSSSSSSPPDVVTSRRDRSGSLSYTVEEDACFFAPLADVLPRHRLMIRFVAVDGSLIFDEKIPAVWDTYLASLQANTIPSAKSSTPPALLASGGRSGV